MSALPCPKCQAIGFTWAIDDEQRGLTEWHCSLCHYVAEEDESEQRSCPACGAEGAIRLRDEIESYLYCTLCRSRSARHQL
jgi:predicted  nucleic acid-binding Zn ribbon protein